MRLTINDRVHDIPSEWQDESLLFTLRELLGLTGAKYGCGVGQCGACMVLLDGEARQSCLLLVADVVDRKIETIESLADTTGTLSPVQQAWLDAAVPQCGYCQAGQIISATALLRRNPQPSAAEIEAAMADNLCRCGTQNRIRQAMRQAAEAGR